MSKCAEETRFPLNFNLWIPSSGWFVTGLLSGWICPQGTAIPLQALTSDAADLCFQWGSHGLGETLSSPSRPRTPPPPPPRHTRSLLSHSKGWGFPRTLVL